MEGKSFISWQYFHRLEAFHLLAFAYNWFVASKSKLGMQTHSKFLQLVNIKNIKKIYQLQVAQYLLHLFNLYSFKLFTRLLPQQAFNSYSRCGEEAQISCTKATLSRFLHKCWNSAQLKVESCESLTFSLTLINAALFYYYLTRRGHNHLRPQLDPKIKVISEKLIGCR